jgi:hypothetical protein
MILAGLITCRFREFTKYTRRSIPRKWRKSSERIQRNCSLLSTIIRQHSSSSRHFAKVIGIASRSILRVSLFSECKLSRRDPRWISEIGGKFTCPTCASRTRTLQRRPLSPFFCETFLYKTNVSRRNETPFLHLCQHQPARCSFP